MFLTQPPTKVVVLEYSKPSRRDLSAHSTIEVRNEDGVQLIDVVCALAEISSSASSARWSNTSIHLQSLAARESTFTLEPNSTQFQSLPCLTTCAEMGTQLLEMEKRVAALEGRLQEPTKRRWLSTPSGMVRRSKRVRQD